MKTLIKHYPLFSKKMILAVVFVALVFSCSKTNNNPTSVAAKYCTNLGWSNEIGLSGQFLGANNALGHFSLLTADLFDQGGTSKHFSFQSTDGHFINQGGMTFTYDKDNLVELQIGDLTSGRETFTFETNGHLKHTVITSSDPTGDLSSTIAYTYDNNDDPVKIIINSQTTFPDGKTAIADYDITADYLTDKTSILPFVPEITPFSIDFAYSWFLSRHLINKWVIKINGTTEDGVVIPTINFTQQYTYTYDSNGRVSTMVHTGNSKNIYTFTYSGCN
jgi:YD repeat-containing protein